MGRCCDCSDRNGMGNLVTAICMTTAFCCNVAALALCRFVYNPDGFGDFGATVKGIGMYSLENPVNGECYSINWNDWTANARYWTDPHLNSARGCGGFAGLVGFVLVITVWSAMCCGCERSKCLRVTVAIFSVLCTVLAGLMFLFQQSYICTSGTSCGFSQGSQLAVVAVVFYFLAAVVACVTPDAEEESEERFVPPQTATATGAGENVTVEKTMQADGTTVVKTTTIHADGSKTIQETTETPFDEEEAGHVEKMPKAQVE